MNKFVSLVLFFHLITTALCFGDKSDTFNSTHIFKCCPFESYLVRVEKKVKCKDAPEKSMFTTFIKNLNLPLPLNVTIKNYCNNPRHFRFLLNEEEDEFHFQWNNSLHHEGIYFDDFCVDYNDDHKGMQVLVCLSAKFIPEHRVTASEYGNYIFL